MGNYLLKRENELKDKYEIIGDVRGVGLMTAVEIVKDKTSKKMDMDTRNKIVNGCLKKGLLILFCGPSSIRIIPALNCNKEHIDKAMEIFEAEVKRVQAECKAACGTV